MITFEPRTTIPTMPSANVCAGAPSPRQKQGSSSSPSVTPSAGSVTGRPCPSPRSGSSFTGIQLSPRGLPTPPAAAATGGGGGSVSPSPRSNSFSSGRQQQSPRLLPPLPAAVAAALVADGNSCCSSSNSSRAVGVPVLSVQDSKAPGSTSSSYLEKQQQLLGQGAGGGLESRTVASLSSGFSQLGLSTEASESALSLSQLYDDGAEDEAAGTDDIVQALPVLKEQIIDLVSTVGNHTEVVRRLEMFHSYYIEWQSMLTRGYLLICFPKYSYGLRLGLLKNLQPR